MNIDYRVYKTPRALRKVEHREYGNVLFVAEAHDTTEREDTLVGHAVLRAPQPGEPIARMPQPITPYYLDDVHVWPRWRGHGIAARLIHECMLHAVETDTPISCEVFPYGRGKVLLYWKLRHFYENLGFVAPNEFSGEPEPLIWMPGKRALLRRVA